MNIAVINILQNPFFTHFILNEICCNDYPGAAKNEIMLIIKRTFLIFTSP